jgi:hypothetical protein
MSEEVNQTVNVTVGGDVSRGAVNVSGTTINNHHNHQHHHTHQHTVHAHGTLVLQMARATPAPEPPFALQASPAPPARQGTHPRPKPPMTRDITPAMREVLALMRPLPKPVRVDVLIWMRCEFGTSLVADLEPRELHHLRGHVLEVRHAAGITSA